MSLMYVCSTKLIQCSTNILSNEFINPNIRKLITNGLNSLDIYIYIYIYIYILLEIDQ